jgi:transcriptional regulator with XRE-family HTH domain
MPHTLARLRRERALSQQDLADRVGLHRVSIARLETGTQPRKKTAQRIAGELGVEAESIWPQRHAVRRGLLDGPRVAGWIDGLGSGALSEQDYTRSEENIARRLRAWRAGSAADVLVVDRVLMALWHDISELPEQFYLAAPTCDYCGGRGWSPERDWAERDWARCDECGEVRLLLRE